MVVAGLDIMCSKVIKETDKTMSGEILPDQAVNFLAEIRIFKQMIKPQWRIRQGADKRTSEKACPFKGATGKFRRASRLQDSHRIGNLSPYQCKGVGLVT